MNPIDPNGKDGYLLTWFSVYNEIDHAGIEIDNYKKQEVKDNNGKPI